MLTFENLLQQPEFLKFSLSIHYNRSFTDLEQWEQREVISLFHSELLFIKPAIKLIVDNILKNIDYTWDTLSIVDEAVIQRELRMAGYELNCYKLNILPTSVTELREYCVMHTTTTTTKSYQNNKLIDNVSSVLVDYQYLIITIFLIIMLYTDYINIIGGIVIGYIITAILSFFMHEYAQHDSRYGSSDLKITIKPLFNWIFHIIAYLYMPVLTQSTVTGDIRSHILHHKIWKTDNDGIMASIKDNWFKHLCNPGRRADINESPELLHTINMSAYKSKWLFNNFLVKNRIYILSIIHLMVILIFGMTAYLSYFIFPIWYFVIIVGATTDFYFHSTYQNRTPPKDAPWWTVPIWFTLTYHISHHAKPNVLFFGNSWIKYINLQYWIFLLAYTTDETDSNRIY